MKINVTQCIKCVLDTNDDPDISFDAAGVCSYCHSYKISKKKNVLEGKAAENKLQELVRSIKEKGNNKKYDCLVGLSGGVDSTYVGYLAKQYGLKVLAMHFDNGWNSELAVKNIENIVNKLGFDLCTYVVDWEEFKDMQLSYLKASVVDIEILTDHAIFGALYKTAKKYNIKYILSGTNVATESILPKDWAYNFYDSINIKDIHKKFGTIANKSFPFFNINTRYFNQIFKDIRIVELLNIIPYIKAKAKSTIINELEWRDYGGKHYESIFTRFFQGYICPVKFGFDKRKAHLSNLVCSGQISREEALSELKQPIYNSEQLKIDKEYVIKKFGMTTEEFEQYMTKPNVNHATYPSYTKYVYRYTENFFKGIRPILPLMKIIWKMTKPSSIFKKNKL